MQRVKSRSKFRYDAKRIRQAREKRYREQFGRPLSPVRNDLIPADPVFTSLCEDLRILRTHEPADGSEWPEWLERQIWKDLIVYIATLEYSKPLAACRQR